MGKKSEPAPAPDYSAAIARAQKQSEEAMALSKEQLQWAREQYAQDRQVSDLLVSRMMESSKAAQDAAAKDRQRYETVFQPVEDRVAREAMSYDNDSNISAAMGKAQATVAQNVEAQRAAALAQLEGYGVDPSSTRYAALDRAMRVQGAAAAAGAANNARDVTEQRGQQLRAQVAGMGQQVNSGAMGNTAVGNQVGSSAAQTNLATTGSGAATMGTAPQYFAQSSDSLRTQGGLMGQQFSNNMDRYNAQQSASSGIGGLLGAAAGFFLEDGGAVPGDDPYAHERTTGGVIPDVASTSRGAQVDDVDAKLTAGEFVIPVDVMRWKGEEFFQKVIEQSRKSKPEAPAKPTFGIAARGAPTFQSSAPAIPMR